MLKEIKSFFKSEHEAILQKEHATTRTAQTAT